MTLGDGRWRPDPTGRYVWRWHHRQRGWTDHVSDDDGDVVRDRMLPGDLLPPPPKNTSFSRHLPTLGIRPVVWFLLFVAFAILVGIVSDVLTG